MTDLGSLDLVLQRALATRLNLQISLSQLPNLVEEWMDIHLDRWLEHNPMPHEMPIGQQVQYLAMVGSDLKRVWWGSWGSPSAFIPKMADYFKLCNIAKSDSRALDQIGEHLEPSTVGSWIGVWGKKVTTGWHFLDEQPWSKVEEMFGTHEAKYTLKKWIEDAKIEHIVRFTQSIGEDPYSEIEVPLPGADIGAQVDAAQKAFIHFTKAPMDGALVERIRHAPAPAMSFSVRIRGGKIARVGVLAPGPGIDDVVNLCLDATVACDPKLGKIVGSLAQSIMRVEYGRAGERAGVDVYVEPGDPANNPNKAPSAIKVGPPSDAN